MDVESRFQTVSLGIILATGLGLLTSIYQGWYVPSPFVLIIFGLTTALLYAIHVVMVQGNRNKEVVIVSTLAIYLAMLLTSGIHHIWQWTFISQENITKMGLAIFLLGGAYLVLAYVRVKITYKRVKGNQPHSQKWRVSPKREKELQNSEDVYINIGQFVEKAD